jgi:hypothetical protein
MTPRSLERARLRARIARKAAKKPTRAERALAEIRAEVPRACCGERPPVALVARTGQLLHLFCAGCRTYWTTVSPSGQAQAIGERAGVWQP